MAEAEQAETVGVHWGGGGIAVVAAAAATEGTALVDAIGGADVGMDL